MDLSRRTYLITLCVIAGLFTGILSLRPYYNWDMFPYIALTLGAGDQHQRTFQEAAARMPSHDFELLTARQPLLFSDPGAFQAILPYYQTKPGYTFVTRALYMAGVNATTATYLPSVLSYFVLVIIMGLWLTHCLPYRYALVVTSGVAILPFLSMTARFSSPDMLCAACTVTGLYMLVVERRAWGLALFITAVAVRPDAVILELPLLYGAFRDGITTKRHMWITALACVTTAVWALGNLELIPEYIFTLKPWPGEFTFVGFMTAYFFNLVHGFPSIINSSAPMVMLIFVIARIYQARQISPNRFWLHCLWAGAVSMFIRYLLHPMMEDRFLISAYLIILLGLLHIIFANRGKYGSNIHQESTNLSNT